MSNLLFKIWIFKFELADMMSFFFGIFFGMTIIILFYLYQVLRHLNRKRYLFAATNNELNSEDIKNMVLDAQNRFRDKNLKGEMGNVTYAVDISKELAFDIARKFFPKSKYPFFEITIDESLMLMTYINKRLEEILDYRGLRMLRKIRISVIIKWTNTKKVIEENPIVQTSKKFKLKELYKTAMGAINVINPVYWVKKLVINRSLDIIIRKLCLVTIGIVGEETYKVYSKKVFNEEMEIDTGVENLISEIKEELVNVGESTIANLAEEE